MKNSTTTNRKPKKPKKPKKQQKGHFPV